MLALGDIFGGNAFQVCLFLAADLIAGAPVLPTAGRLNGWLASLGVALTAIYAFGIILRPERCIAGLGPRFPARDHRLCARYRRARDAAAVAGARAAKIPEILDRA